MKLMKNELNAIKPKHRGKDTTTSTSSDSKNAYHPGKTQRGGHNNYQGSGKKNFNNSGNYNSNNNKNQQNSGKFKQGKKH